MSSDRLRDARIAKLVLAKVPGMVINRTGLYANGYAGYVNFDPTREISITLDGAFTPKCLTALAWWVSNWKWLSKLTEEEWQSL